MSRSLCLSDGLFAIFFVNKMQPLQFICSAMSDTMIMDAIASYLVLPNRLTVPLVADLHVAQLRSPLPRVTHPLNTQRAEWSINHFRCG